MSEDRDAVPETPEQVAELGAWFKANRYQDADDLPIFCGYLTEQCGLDQAMCRDALKEVWPEASEQIAKWIPPEEYLRLGRAWSPTNVRLGKAFAFQIWELCKTQHRAGQLAMRDRCARAIATAMTGATAADPWTFCPMLDGLPIEDPPR